MRIAKYMQCRRILRRSHFHNLFYQSPLLLKKQQKCIRFNFSANEFVGDEVVLSNNVLSKFFFFLRISFFPINFFFILKNKSSFKKTYFRKKFKEKITFSQPCKLSSFGKGLFSCIYRLKVQVNPIFLSGVILLINL